MTYLGKNKIRFGNCWNNLMWLDTYFGGFLFMFLFLCFILCLCINCASSHKQVERQSMLSDGLFIYTNKNFFKCYWQCIFFFHILLLHVFFHFSTAVLFKLKRKSPLYIKAITPCFTYTLQMFSMLFVFKFLLWCKHILHMIVNKSIHFFVVPVFFWQL